MRMTHERSELSHLIGLFDFKCRACLRTGDFKHKTTAITTQGGPKTENTIFIAYIVKTPSLN